nr:EAL domain-containing protein [Paenibacillus selenitireducens]
MGIELPVSINISLKQLEQADFVGHLIAIVEQYGVDYAMLELEVTETIAMNDVDDAAKVLRELHAQGFLISIDDFGTGYSSLSYLMLYPIHTLKIDRAFIRDISSSDEVKLVDIIINMAHQLGVDVIAEGVETREQMEYLKNHHCRYIQGYLISKPLPVEEITQMLIRSQSQPVFY